MAMQQGGKDASAESPPSASGGPLSEEQAEEFASSFTPSWDAGEAPVETAMAKTLVDAAPPATAASTAAPRAPNPKLTLIGTAPAPAPSALVAVAEPAATKAAKPDPVSTTKPDAPPAVSAKGTQIMPRVKVPADAEARKPPPPARASSAPVTADPFSAPARRKEPSRSEDLDDVIVAKKSRTPLFIGAGAVVVIALVLKFALGGDDAPATPTATPTVGPAVTTAEIPPPPPKVEAPPPTTTTAAAKPEPSEPPPTPLPAPTTPPAHVAHVAPPTRSQPAAAAAPRSEPRPARGATTPAGAGAQAAPAATKTAPKPSNGGIVRDNPF